MASLKSVLCDKSANQSYDHKIIDYFTHTLATLGYDPAYKT